MHISEGVLSAPVLIAGAGACAAAVAYGTRKMDYERIPQVAVLSSGFFVASLIHVPIGPAAMHLVLNGVCGLVLGWAAFPAILIALGLQAVLFQFGGITTLGINTLNMALPAVLCYWLFSRLVTRGGPTAALIAGFATGALSVLGTGLMVAASLVFTGESFTQAARMIVLAHIPVMLIEGTITALCVGFLRKVRPEVLDAANGGSHVQAIQAG